MRKPSLLVIFLTVFIDLIGFGIVLPILPKYGERYGAHGWQIGLIIASFSIMQFFFAPFWGKLSDRIGRRPVLLLGNFGSAVSYALFALSASSSLSTNVSLAILVGSRVFAGICGATLSVASAYIADISKPEERSKRMGLIGMAFGLGFILGPVLGGLSAKHLGLQGPGWVAAGFCGFNFVLACFILGETRDPSKNAAATPRARWEDFRHAMQNPKLAALISLFFLATLSFTCFESTLPLLLTFNFKSWDESHVSYIFTYCGFLAALIQGGVIGRLVKAFGEEKLIAGSLVVVAISLVAIPYAHNLSFLLIALALFAAGSGINRAPTMGLISLNAPAELQGTILGVAQSAGTLARCIGPILATTLYAYSVALPYITAGGIALIAAVFAWQTICKHPQHSHAAPAPAA